MQDPKRPSPPSRHLDRHPQDPHYSQIHPQTSQVPSSPPTFGLAPIRMLITRCDMPIPKTSIPAYGSLQTDLSAPYRRPPSYMYEQGSYTKSPIPRQLDTAIIIASFPALPLLRLRPPNIYGGIKFSVQYLIIPVTSSHSSNLHFLLKRLSRQEERLRIQPSFILSILAMAKLMKSSTMELGAEGMRAAMVYVSDAHAPTTIQSILNGSTQPLLKLHCGLTFTPMTAVCLLSPDAIDPPNPYGPRTYILPWDNAWSSDEIRDEEIRRLCWSALSLISEYIAQCEAFNEDAHAFIYLTPPTLGPHFSKFSSFDSLSPKESVWALYCRSMLLWNFCNRFRQPSQEEERAEQSHEAFLEVQAIEDSLNAHQCNLDTTLIYTTREYIHNIRMLVTQALRWSAPGPIFKRKQAEDWLFYENRLIAKVNTVVHQLSGPDGPQLTRRPYRINWFINQLTICLVLWNHDPTLDDALKLAKQILGPIDVLNALWPCHSIQQKCDSLRQQLVEACISRNIEQPFPPSYTVPAFLRSR
ncbi:hypothetical protein CPB84DRAFT_1750754 [Gymnopilus junonius]|uniref:Uncharacterized protein n=1 Tax=Gymnopilus junonius TaxID=109634 RepID=A0A9P5TIW5_GYMJU|nr:hypothetical protein CPB84DRAFT_1750754 [Gymnopilus junonius]